ncbi:MAG: hypothetical protein SOW30_12565 [Parabacteroides sp.]|nr:hypothetical protein [Parabacteroides sp.]
MQRTEGLFSKKAGDIRFSAHAKGGYTTPPIKMPSILTQGTSDESSNIPCACQFVTQRGVTPPVRTLP